MKMGNTGSLTLLRLCMEEVPPSSDNCTLEVLPSSSSGHRKSHFVWIIVPDTRLRFGRSLCWMFGERGEFSLYTGKVGEFWGAPVG